MKVPENHIAQVVNEASKKMGDSYYITRRVDKLVQAQPHITHYVLSFQKELTVTGIVSVLFHAALILESIIRSTGKTPGRVTYEDLDDAVMMAPTVESLAKIEPNLASFIAGNVELEQGPQASEVARKILTHVAMALVDITL
jgi:hypothetical protein